MLKRRNRSGDASYIRNARHRVDIIRAHWGNRAAANITRVDISRLLDTFGNRPATQRMVQATIGAFFSFCEERYGIAHPCRHMKRRGGARERERFLSDDELRRALPVMRELGYPRGDVMLFSLLTGRRLREVTDMTWSEVDLVARVHHLPASHSKNRKAHTVPLSAGAVDVFKAAEGRKVGGGEYVFHGTRDRPIVEIRRALAQVNNAVPFKFHDLRRTAASHLGAIGCPTEIIKAILNHNLEMGITGIYVHVDLLPRMREWLDRLSAHYDSLIAVPVTISKVSTKAHLPAVQAKAAMTTKARKLERKTRAAELDMEIMRAREANGLPVISPMLGLPLERWECEFRDYLVALGDPRIADAKWLASRIREENRRARWFEKWFDAWFEESADGFDFGKEEVRRPVGQPQHPRRTPEERQGAMKAAHAGVAAFADGIAESSCPHKVATLTYSAWRKGWQEARDRAGP